MKNSFNIAAKIACSLVLMICAISIVIFVFSIFSYLFISAILFFAGAVMGI